MSGFAKEWALRWVEGFVVSHLFGKTSLNIVKRIVRRAANPDGVKPRVIGAFITLKTLDPSLNMSRKTREERAQSLPEFIENLDKGEREVKCPYCGYEGEFKLLKTWKYRWWDVYFYECQKCGKRFRWQVKLSGRYRSYVIRVGTGGRKKV
jgi:DNA-directed RNA polymerase subunit RPC12/RpoP